MAKKKKREDRLSPRQRQSKQAMREKELQIKRQQFIQKLQIIGGVAFVMFVGVVGMWAWKTSALSRGVQTASDKVFGATAKSGYAVQNMYIEGRNRTPMKDINEALDVNKGEPILRLKLDEMRERLEKIESIKYATIERALPDTLYVRIEEREPIAIWQYKGKKSLIDDKGVVMSGLDITPYKSLPLIVGEDAPQNIASLMELLNSQPELAKRFTAAVWVGDRRWNIKLKPKQIDAGAEDIEVQLPEEEYLAAWKKLAELQQKEKLLDRDIKVIDLRIQGRLFIKLPENEINVKPTNAKDT
jgi:cell division protein FtsQ